MSGVLKMSSKEYIPAFRYKWLTPFFDLFLRWTMPELPIKTRLIQEISLLHKDSRILDLGCGTGTLAILIKKAFPDSLVFGLDADAKVLEIARQKTLRDSLILKLDEGMSDMLPYPDCSFDLVVSSLVFHHLGTEEKIRSLEQIFRVLTPGGGLIIADFGKPKTIIMKAVSLVMRNFEKTAGNFQGLIPLLIRSSGFGNVNEFATFSTIFGPISLIKATKPN
jgi:ubiquinone/menaquinone biosynthesis C-methylase UbiE